ncbi:MAG: amidohydrolase family protein, partial [Planctomycetota bacterium]
IGAHDRVICPAFTDAHLHFPQIDSVGCDGMHLLRWLDEVIFPAEIWWGRGQAMSMARTAVRRAAMQGTVGLAAYLTSHAEIGRDVIGWLTSRTPMRTAAGRVAMDRAAPEDLTGADRERARMTPTPSPIIPVPEGADASRHRSSLNPRFAVSCTPELLAEAGWFAGEQPEVLIQTHLSESLEEVQLVKELFPDEPHYVGVYDRFGLLTDRTLLAHCVHLSSDEWEMIRARRAVVVHCPAANIFLQSGLFDLDAAREHGVRFALGSDVAAGSDIAMPRVARGMIETAKVRKLTIAPKAAVPSPADAWDVITRGNAEAVGWTDGGRLAVGCQADVLVLRVPETWHDEHLVGRLIYNWSSSLIETRVFAGRVFDPATI